MRQVSFLSERFWREDFFNFNVEDKKYLAKFFKPFRITVQVDIVNNTCHLTINGVKDKIGKIYKFAGRTGMRKLEEILSRNKTATIIRNNTTPQIIKYLLVWEESH